MTQISIPCPNCGPAIRLIVRTNKATGSQFLGCPNWPRCEHTEPLPTDIQLRLTGAPRLPGF